MNSPLMTQAEYARHRGVRASAVSNWKASGFLVFAEDPDRPNAMKVDVVRTDARLNARLDPMRGRPSTGAPALVAPSAMPMIPASDNVATVRMDLVKQQIAGHKLKNAQLAAELGPIMELERRATEIGRMARERMHAMGRDLAERLSVETEVRQIIALLGAEIDRVFSELAAEVEGGLLVDDDDGDDDLPIENDIDEEAVA